MDFVSPILDVTCRLCGCIGNTTNYIRHLQDNLNSLRSEMEKLREQRNDVRRQVENSQQMQPTEQVGGWLRRVEELEREVDQILQQGDEEIQRRCLKICPRNCRSSHRLGRNVCRKLQAVSNMKSEGNSIPVTAPLAPAHAQEIPIDRTVGLDSISDKLLRLLRDDDGPGIIGIYGMGGVGKTTLLKKLNNELAIQLSDGKFDEVIWVVVSRDLSSVESVQDKIGKKLGFPDTWSSGRGQDEKKQDIFRVLKMKNFVLLLDDIWERIDLHEVGVPLSNNQNKAGKVVFTTRSEEVCGFMEAKKKIQVECLAWQQAWDLFKEKVGEEILNSDHEIEKLARDVCKECDGLPLVLITIGRAMASRTTLKEWETAISMLKISTFRISGMKDEVFRRLKFSYDSLPDDTTRICFLYCALYPEDWNIGVRQLINFWIGEGFLDDECDNIDEASNLAHEIITRLKRACLLLDNEYTGDVNMHDVIRDMALWIVSEKYFVRAGGGYGHRWKKKTELMVAPLFSKWEKAERVFFLNNFIPELRGTPTCLNLLTLNLSHNSLRNISDSFFESMPALKVLDLSGNDELKKLPASLFGLISLQHLDLSHTGILGLPTEFKSLVNLKYFYLSAVSKNIIIPPQVISSLLSLKKWEMHYRGIAYKGIELFLDELESLNHLQCLIFAVKTKLELQLLSLHKLRSCMSGLYIKDCRGSSSLQLSSLRNFNRLEMLDITSCDDLEELSMSWEEGERAAVPPRYNSSWDHIIDAGSGSFHNLRRVSFNECKVLKDVTWVICVPNLQTLAIWECEGMEEVIKDADCSSTTNHDHDIGRERSLGVFARLQELYLFHLPQLKSIYSHPLPFPSLSKVMVINCPKLNKLPFDSNSGKDTLRLIECKKEWWDKLEWENEETQSVFSPFLKEYQW